MPLWLFTDQYDLVVPNTVQDIVIAVLCMLFIAFLLIPQPFCALWVAFTIGSIDLGVLGYMTLWGVNLDAISMITIIMSVGFSVDYSAHILVWFDVFVFITYGYVISKEPDPRDRVVMPSATSGGQLFKVCPLLTEFSGNAVFLAISIGLIHGLIFLPLMLSLFVRAQQYNFPAEFRPMSHLRGSNPWLEMKFADAFDSSTMSSILDAPPLVPTRPPSTAQQPPDKPPPLPPKNFKF
ncbi:hypothetical protein OSTOST_19000 [Ostertagia ostertagi]